MAILTYLSPDNPYPCYTSKTFKLVGNIPEQISGYRLGEHFIFETDEVFDLIQTFNSLKKRSTNWFRIAGEPAPGLDPILEPIARNKINFPECESNVLLLDIDGWKVKNPDAWDLTKPQATHKLIKELLIDQGFSFLAATDFVFLLTSSQWTTNTLNCHLYFYLDKPIHIAKLRDWCTALARIRQKKVFDPAVQRSVQPDYISKRKCIGFDDPMDEAARISYCSNSYKKLSLYKLNEQIEKDLKSVGWKDNKSHQPPINNNWHSTLSICGAAGRGINEPAHRAAAQLVQEIGRGQVLANVRNYSEQMHSIAWDHIHKNDPYGTGERDHQKDISTYNLARFQQYLVSACNQSFGDKVDNLKEQVSMAIQEAATGNVSALFDRHVLDSYSRLKLNHVGAYAHIKSIFKSKLRGVVSITDFEKACRTGGDNQSLETQDGVFQGEAGSENSYINRVLDEFDWIEDHHGNQWCGWKLGNGVGDYRITQVDSNLRNVLYQTGMRLSGGTISDKFGTKALQLLYGQEEYNKGTPDSRFKEAHVGLRVSPTGGAYSSSLETWINLGIQPNGKSVCARVDDQGIDYVSTADCKVRWRNPTSAAPILVASNTQIQDRFGGYEGLVRWTKNRLFDFFPIRESERSIFIGMALAILSGRGTSPLVEFVGPHACGKSVASKLLLDLLDPVKGGASSNLGLASLTVVNPDNFINVIQDRYLSVFDNASKLSVKWQDNLCQVATGISKDQRVMYVGAFVKVYAKRPIILTSLETLVTRPDLESRKETLHFDGMNFSIKPHLLFDQWERDKPFLYVGLLHMLSKGLKIFDRDMAETGLDARRMWYNIGDHLYFENMEDIIGIQEERKISSALQMLINSEVCMGLIAWLQHEYDNGHVSIDQTMRHHLTSFRSFIRERQGTTIEVKTKFENIKWRVSALDINIPATPRGLGWELNKNFHIIQRLTGWNVNAGGKRRGNSFNRLFVKDKVQYGKLPFDSIEDLL